MHKSLGKEVLFLGRGIWRGSELLRREGGFWRAWISVLLEVRAGVSCGFWDVGGR